MAAYHAKKRLGQNFLVSTTIIKKILDTAAPKSGQTVIEIGAGRGALTTGLAETGAQVTAVEFDTDMIGYLTRLLRKYDNVEILQQDFLTLEVDPERHGRIVLVGNLPYNITSPVIDWCLKYHGSLVRAVFMVQKEMADRIAASPGSKDWSPLSIFTQMSFDVERCFDVPPESFRPPPKVTSTVVTLTPRTPEKVEDHEALEAVVRASFVKRRKLLKNNLVPAIIPDNLQAEKVFGELDLAADSRAEQLSIEQFLKLTNALLRHNILSVRS